MSTNVTLPKIQDIQAATEAQRELTAYLATGFETKRIQIVDADDRTHEIRLPASALEFLAEILAELAEGNAVKVVPVHAELTTQEAADLLNVSRPHLVKLLEDNAIPFHKTGKHRRVRFDDLMSYKEGRDVKSKAALAALAEQAQTLNLGYE